MESHSAKAATKRKNKTVYTHRYFLSSECSVFMQAENQKRNQISEMKRAYSTDATHETLSSFAKPRMPLFLLNTHKHKSQRPVATAAATELHREHDVLT